MRLTSSRRIESRTLALASGAAQAALALGFIAFALANVNLSVNGLFLGAVLALGAMGITLIYGLLRFANLAHGDMMTLGAYSAFFLLTSVLPDTAGLGPFTFGYPFLIALPAGMAVAAALAAGMELLVFRRLRVRKSNIVTLSIASLGVGIAVRGFVQMIWDTQVRYFPNEARAHYMLPGDVSIAPNHLFVGAVALALAAALHYRLTRTKQGKAMRATADNPDLARASGIDTDDTMLRAWVTAGALAGAAGILLVAFNATSQATPSLGFQMLVPLFAAVIVGGIGNPYGAFAGALIIGVSMEASTAFVPPTYKPAVAFAVMIIVLLFRPRGLFGSKDW